uniref:Alpha/beta hydrolase fold-3 domain-containing protein n=1 Tax=Hordeum vulgare subsp. vulgare TaxID=112509 RepID=A0A8I6WWF3_HORVV
MDPSSETVYEIPGFIGIHKSGPVERLVGTQTVPPSPSGDPANGVASKDVVLDLAASISARLYLPAATAAEPRRKFPVVVYYHGGAFVVQSAASPIYHKYAASLVTAALAVVVSVNYRLAPEHPLPAAYDDAFVALRAIVAACRPDGAEPWLAAHGDASRVVLAGDSSGANMAHNTAIRLGKEGAGGYGDRCAASPWRPPFTTPASCGAFGPDHPYINPAAAAEEWRQLGSGRVLVTTAELCWFVERARAYAEGIKACGWAGELEFYETKGEKQTYFLFKPDCDSAAKELTVVADFVKGC